MEIRHTDLQLDFNAQGVREDSQMYLFIYPIAYSDFGETHVIPVEYNAHVGVWQMIQNPRVLITEKQTDQYLGWVRWPQYHNHT